MSNSKTLSWNDRFALLDHYKPADSEACTALGITDTELQTARDMRNAGAFTASNDIDVESYSKMFNKTPAKPQKKQTTTSIVRPGSKQTAEPETATKKPKVLKKRGRKGDKIAIAFKNIPGAPTSVDQFATDNGVSLAVLRQSKRFDKSPELGTVHVKKDKGTKTLMIWREAPSS